MKRGEETWREERGHEERRGDMERGEGTWREERRHGERRGDMKGGGEGT